MMHHPPHPGEILLEEVISPLGLPITEAAKRLKMSRAALSRVLNQKAGISPDLALRLERAGISSATFWLGLQSNYDLWRANKRRQPQVQSLKVAA